MMMFQMSLSDSFSPIMRHICSFHDMVMVVVVFILSVVLFIFFSITLFPTFSRSMKSSEGLELVWSVLPCLILGFLAAPSLYILYLTEEFPSPSMSLKVSGHQWYWTYEYGDFGKEVTSYLIPTSEVWKGGNRLLEVDSRVCVPLGQEIRVIVTSADVIHSWTLPSLGVKVDAIPGRLNQIGIFSERVGVLYGQCSEICGANHSFMPICVEIVPMESFFSL